MQAIALAPDDGGSAAAALLAASQASAQLKASNAKEQHLVSTFLHHLCEKVRIWLAPSANHEHLQVALRMQNEKRSSWPLSCQAHCP